jgi:uncharacterized protein
MSFEQKTVWIDITNSPHVAFWKPFIEGLHAEFDFLVTCRPYANTVDLVQAAGFPHRIIGKHYGKSPVRKVLGLGARVYALKRELKGRIIHLAVSHSSFYSPLAAKCLGIPCIYINDNEHAAGNLCGYIWAERVMMPFCCAGATKQARWIKRPNVKFYDGVKEAIYLSKQPDLITAVRERAERRCRGRPKVYVRPEPRNAQYYRANSDPLPALLDQLAKSCDVFVLPRDAEQARRMDGLGNGKVSVARRVISLAEIIRECDVFVGAGGTMTREAAVAGVPTLSTYQEALLQADEFLIREGAMRHSVAPTADDVLALLNQADRKRANGASMLQTGSRAFEQIVNEIVATCR